MRTLVLRLTLKPGDRAFDLLTADELLASVACALHRGYPLVDGDELTLEWLADTYEPIEELGK